MLTITENNISVETMSELVYDIEGKMFRQILAELGLCIHWIAGILLFSHVWSVELHLDFTRRAQMRVTPGTARIIVHNDAVPILIHLMTGKHN